MTVLSSIGSGAIGAALGLSPAAPVAAAGSIFSRLFDTQSKGFATSDKPAAPSSQADATQDTADNGTAALEAALAAFTKEASMTPAERVRRDVLKSMNLTEAQVAAMPPAQRKTTEDAISAEVAKRLQMQQGHAPGAQQSASIDLTALQG